MDNPYSFALSTDLLESFPNPDVSRLRCIQYL
jgi:hypothetical protein